MHGSTPAGVEPRGNTQKIELQVGGPCLRRTGPVFFSKNELQSGEVDRAEVAERENTARMGDGELNIHTNLKSDEMSHIY